MNVFLAILAAIAIVGALVAIVLAVLAAYDYVREQRMLADFHDEITKERRWQAPREDER